MKKLLLVLLTTISFIANAQIPGVNDSIFVEPKEAKEYPQWLLADSINGVPLAMSKYYSEGLNGFNIELYEVEDIISHKKQQAIFFHYKLQRKQIWAQCSYEELNIIINAIKKLYEYSQTPLIEDIEESVSYKKDLVQQNNFYIDLFFDNKNNKWTCSYGINNIFSPYYDVEILPILTAKMTNAIFKHDQREQMHREPIFKKEHNKDGGNQYYFEYGDSLVLRLVANENINKEYSKELFTTKHNIKINNILNKTIKTEYKDLDAFSTYGILDVIIDKQGKASRVKLILNKQLSEKLSHNTIGLMLKKIKHYKFPPISNTNKLNEVEYINARIPLTSDEDKRITELIEQNIIIPYLFKCPKLVIENKGENSMYYMDYGNDADKKFAEIKTNVNYSNKLVKERFITDLNFNVNEIANDKYQQLKNLDSYGLVEVIINKNGWVAFSRLSLNKIVSDALDEITITKILGTIDNYRFKSIEDYPGNEFLKVFIPLKGNPQF